MVEFVFPIPTNVTTLPQMFRYFNSLTDIGQGGMLGVIIMIFLSSILFMMIRGTAGVKRAFGVATFFNVFVALFFRYAFALINDWTLTASVILALVGLFMIMGEASRYE